jgi:hypothetical protein
MGVPEGVPLGVEVGLATPTRDVLAEERGVTLLPMKALTGVTSSWADVLTRGVLPTTLRGLRPGWELLADAAEGARRGVTGVFAVRVVARVGFSGREVLVLVRSMGIVWMPACGIRGRCEELGGCTWPSGGGNAWLLGGKVRIVDVLVASAVTALKQRRLGDERNR